MDGIPEPENEPTPEIFGYSATPESEHRSSVSVKVVPEQGYPSAEPKDRPFSEPEPEWESARKTWEAAWPIHTVGNAVILAFVALVAAYFTTRTIMLIIALRRCRENNVRVTHGNVPRLPLALNILILLFGITRSSLLIVDPYMSRGVVAGLGYRTVWAAGWPCFTAVFSLLLLALLDTLHLRAPADSPRWQQPAAIVLYTAIHLSVVVATEVLVAFIPTVWAMAVFCQLIFIIFTIIMAVGYVLTAVKIHQTRRVRKPGFIHQCSLLTISVFTLGILAFIMAITHTYGTFGMFGAFSSDMYARPWPWWAFQTSMRITEATICGVILFIVNRNCTKKRKVPDVQMSPKRETDITPRE